MNVPFNFRGQVEGLDGGSWIAETFKTIINAISAVWDVQHREDGAHSTVSFGSLTGPNIDVVVGSPEGVVSAPLGSVRLNANGGTSTTIYTKESGGTGPTGWVAEGSGLAPDGAQYLVSTASAALTAERVATDTATITWDFGTAGQAKANATGSAATLVVNSTPISGGTTTRLLYDKASTVGETVGMTWDSASTLLQVGTVIFSSAGVIAGAAARGAGAITGMGLEAGRNSSGAGAAGLLALQNLSGGYRFIWTDAANVVRIGASAPTESGSVSDTSGSRIQLVPPVATTLSTPLTPAGTASTTGVMMGLAQAITPALTGRVMVMISGVVANTTTADGAKWDIRMGTGTAPTNGAALTGTVYGGQQSMTFLTGVLSIPFSISALVTGLTVTTAYWVDVDLAAVTGGTATMTQVSCSVFEI